MIEPPPLAALLLTGGSSRRMGFDKAGMIIDGESCALRLARLLSGVAEVVVEVGGEWTGLVRTVEAPPGAGPLAAVAAGRRLLRHWGHDGPALVLACDLPRMNHELLALLAGWPGDSTVLPVVDEHVQPLCARWSRDDLDAAVERAAAGEASLRACPDRATATLIGPPVWSVAGGPEVLADADCPDDLDRLGVRWRRGSALPVDR